jgi:hypothetical protein
MAPRTWRGWPDHCYSRNPKKSAALRSRCSYSAEGRVSRELVGEHEAFSIFVNAEVLGLADRVGVVWSDTKCAASVGYGEVADDVFEGDVDEIAGGVLAVRDRRGRSPI